MVRQELDLPSPPEVNKPSPPTGVSEEIYEFLIEAIKCHTYQNLDPLERNLIGLYFGTKSSLENLTFFAQTRTRNVVKKLIISGLKKIWEQLPADLKEKYPQQKVIKLKSRHIKHSSQTLAKMSEATKNKWRDPIYRANVIDSEQGWRREKKSLKNIKRYRKDSGHKISSELRDLWEVAKEQDLLEKMISKNFLNPEQLQILKNYFENDGQNGHGESPSEWLLERFGMAVARLG